MTAWSAKVRTSSICRSVNGSTRWRGEPQHADRFALAQQRHAQRSTELSNCNRLGKSVFGVRGDIGDMDDLPLKRGPSDEGVAARDKYSPAQNRIVLW
jgi:hypothetical protein